MGLGDVARSLFWGMALLILASAASCSYFALAALKGGEPRVAPDAHEEGEVAAGSESGAAT